MIKLLYFAHLREALGTSGEKIELPVGVTDVTTLRSHLALRGEAWSVLTQSQSLRAAVNQRMVGTEALIADGDEIAFFPPVTGG
ncbi:MAG: molybdopterin converting factor subunit 1 [Sterolibacterium sp.]|nr:molybdopterin converting factor subunit 1 [Sterolibacterium sp.]